MTIALVTDSTADIPPALAEERHIQVISNLLVMDGQSLEDGAGISRHEFYRRLPGLEHPPTTATASVGVYQETYQRLLGAGAEAVLSIHASGKLTGVLNAASTAAADFGSRVRVLDSQQLSLGLGFQVLAAAELAARYVPMDEILTHLDDIRRRVRVIAMLDTLEYVRRSGRVSWAKARLGNLLQVKPFVQLTGESKVLSLGEARTRSKGIRRLKDLLVGLGELEWLAVLHTNAEADARQFLGSLERLPRRPSLLVNVTPVIGVHVGPNGLGFAAIVQ